MVFYIQKNGQLHKLSDLEALLLQGFPHELAIKAKTVRYSDEQIIISSRKRNDGQRNGKNLRSINIMPESLKKGLA